MQNSAPSSRHPLAASALILSGRHHRQEGIDSVLFRMVHSVLLELQTPWSTSSTLRVGSKQWICSSGGGVKSPIIQNSPGSIYSSFINSPTCPDVLSGTCPDALSGFVPHLSVTCPACPDIFGQGVLRGVHVLCQGPGMFFSRVRS